jgi:micrococcal nuclease
MKKNRLCVLFCLVLCSLFESDVCAANWYQVRWVDDGDTIVLNDGRRVRYIGINAPEVEHEDQRAEPFGNEAKRFNTSLVFQKKVRVEVDKERFDQFARLLGYVFLQDGSFVNSMILSNGYAYFLYRQPNIKYKSILLKSQRKAMSLKKGIWNHWREKNATYIGSRRSKRFHLPTCTLGKRVKPKNRVLFLKKWDAFWEGYAPAKRCLPKFEIPKN